MRTSRAVAARCLFSTSKKPPQVTGAAVEFFEVLAKFGGEEHGKRKMEEEDF
jgi:hypothetical protein